EGNSQRVARNAILGGLLLFQGDDADCHQLNHHLLRGPAFDETRRPAGGGKQRERGHTAAVASSAASPAQLKSCAGRVPASIGLGSIVKASALLKRRFK